MIGGVFLTLSVGGAGAAGGGVWAAARARTGSCLSVRVCERGVPFAGGSGGSIVSETVPSARCGRGRTTTATVPRALVEPTVRAGAMGLASVFFAIPAGAGVALRDACARLVGVGCVTGLMRVAVLPVARVMMLVLTGCGVGSFPVSVPIGGEGGRIKAPGIPFLSPPTGSEGRSG